MDLEIQLQSLITSLIYGMYLSLIYNILYKYLYSNNIFIKITWNIMFSVIHALIYFQFMKLINEGIIHIYFIVLLIIGFIIGNKKTKLIRTTPRSLQKNK